MNILCIPVLADKFHIDVLFVDVNLFSIIYN